MKKEILITGCGGLIGREATEFFLEKGFSVIGVDNNMRKYFFGEDGSVLDNIEALKNLSDYFHYAVDIRDYADLEKIFLDHKNIVGVIHAAAQPSHDWAVKEPFTDFHVNCTATLNLLELVRKHCIGATFIFMSTNKVYGDNPNRLPLVEKDTRFELEENHPYHIGINEEFSIDAAKHSLFGCSKLAADVYVQEYGKYFGMNTVTFRGGCLTGSKHKGAELHGFLNYLVKCNKEGRTYNIFGYKGKQVRDNIHSSDLISAFYEVMLNPRSGEIYNIGGGRYSNCSLIEAVDIIESITKIKTTLNYVNDNRIGDHIWWISDTTKFKLHYPNWIQKYDIRETIKEIVENYKGTK